MGLEVRIVLGQKIRVKSIALPWRSKSSLGRRCLVGRVAATLLAQGEQASVLNPVMEHLFRRRQGV